ncbi:MAG: DUF3124 domain-containing protein [Gallionella sp.]|jgi:hypothetical protein
MMMKVRVLVLLMASWSASTAMAGEEVSTGQSVYLPIYSHIWHGDRAGEEKSPAKSLVSVLVSIRNTSLKTPIRIFSARYYSTEGRMIRDYLAKPATLNAMGTLELFVERKESVGGSGANFVIQWDAAVATNPPMVEAVHADIRGGSHALTFITTAHPIDADK